MKATLCERASRVDLFDMSRPKTSTFPLCIILVPAMRDMMVDLPTPSAPTSPTVVPRGILIETWSRARVFPKLWLTSVTSTQISSAMASVL